MKNALFPRKFLFFLTLVIAIFLFSPASSLHTKMAPDFSLSDTQNNLFNLSDFRGKIVILDFMATWCLPCDSVIDVLKEIQEKYADIIIISIDVDSTESNKQLEKFKEKHDAEWFFAIDNNGVSEKYGVIQIPTIVIITPSGEVSYKHVGKITPSQLSIEIEKARRGKISSSIFYLPLPLIAFIGGVLSFFSPCSFPLLPAYMAYYIGKYAGTKDGVRKAILGGIKPALGIMVFYGIIGIPVIFAGNMVKPFLSFFQPVVGMLIILLGIEMLIPLNLFTRFPSLGLTEKISRFSMKEKFGLFFYGMAYGGAAAGCTLPIFIAILLLSLSGGGFLGGLIIFLLYIAGMMGLMICITILIAFSKHALVDKLKITTKYVEKIGGFVLIISGAYLIYYYLATVMEW